MERYRYEPGELTVSMFISGAEISADDIDREENIEGFKVFDSQRGNTDDAWVAFSRDRDGAELVVRLLNDDERLKAQATLLRREST